MATIYRCIADDGSTTFTDEPCPVDARASRVNVTSASAMEVTPEAAAPAPGSSLLVAVLLFYLVVSVCTLLAYGLDKRRAVRGQWRLSESSLHLLDLIGGWPGGLLGQRVFRHKTRKRGYQLVFRLTVLFHVAFWIDFLVLGFGAERVTTGLVRFFG